MDTDLNKQNALEFFKRAFHQGDLSVIDEQLAEDGVDHQEPEGTDFRAHLKEVVTGMRSAFPDLHFEVHEILAEGDIVAFRSTMTGTHLGSLNVGPVRGIPPTQRRVAVAHMHFIRVQNGMTTDLWHVWDNLGLMRQLGLLPVPQAKMGEHAIP